MLYLKWEVRQDNVAIGEVSPCLLSYVWAFVSKVNSHTPLGARCGCLGSERPGHWNMTALNDRLCCCNSVLIRHSLLLSVTLFECDNYQYEISEYVLCNVWGDLSVIVSQGPKAVCSYKHPPFSILGNTCIEYLQCFSCKDIHVADLLVWATEIWRVVIVTTLLLRKPMSICGSHF